MKPPRGPDGKGVTQIPVSSDPARRINEAIPTVREKKEQTASELDAFERFFHSVKELETSNTAGVNMLGYRSMDHGSDGGISPVIASYQDTVMAMPHFDRNYCDSLEDSMGYLLGEDVARSVLNNKVFTLQLKQGLLHAVDATVRSRARLIQRIESELARLQSAQNAIETTNQLISEVTDSIETTPFRALSDRYNDFVDIEDQFENILIDRQEVIHGEDSQLFTYLYQQCPFDYPVIKDILDQLGSLRRAKDSIFVELLNRG